MHQLTQFKKMRLVPLPIALALVATAGQQVRAR
jgi:hypothetical protein